MLRLVTNIPNYANEEILVPAFPEWYKKQNLPKNNFGTKMCPHFMELFKNSYVLKTPQDLLIEYKYFVDENGFEDYAWKFETPSTDWPAHSFWSVETHSLYHQLDPEYSKKYMHFKLIPRFRIKTDDPTKIIVFETFSYTHQSGFLRPVQGILHSTNKIWLDLNINMYAEKPDSQEGKIRFSVGDPICLLYFPNGRPKFKVDTVTTDEYNISYNNVRRHFVGDYWKRVGKLFK